MPNRSTRSHTVLSAILAGTLLLFPDYALADKVEMRKLPSYSAFKGFTLPAGVPEDSAWLDPAYDRQGWQIEAGQDDWKRLVAIEWKAADGKPVTQELKDNAAGTSCTFKLDGFTGNLNCNSFGGDASQADCQLRVVRDDAEDVDKNTAWVRMADVHLEIVSFDATVSRARRFKRRALR